MKRWMPLLQSMRTSSARCAASTTLPHPQVQPDVQDGHWRYGGQLLHLLSASGDCTGHFVNFANIQRTTRRKLPFGVCQVGKAFRNEITPGNFVPYP